MSFEETSEYVFTLFDINCLIFLFESIKMHQLKYKVIIDQSPFIYIFKFFTSILFTNLYSDTMIVSNMNDFMV